MYCLNIVPHSGHDRCRCAQTCVPDTWQGHVLKNKHLHVSRKFVSFNGESNESRVKREQKLSSQAPQSLLGSQRHRASLKKKTRDFVLPADCRALSKRGELITEHPALAVVRLPSSYFQLYLSGPSASSHHTFHTFCEPTPLPIPHLLVNGSSREFLPRQTCSDTSDMSHEA